MKRGTCMTIQGALSAAGAFLSARLGILFPVLMILTGMMVIDFISGMMASKVEAIEHPNDPEYGWSSEKGAKGIAKKVGYLCAIAVAMVVDYLTLIVVETLGITVPAKAVFGLLVAVWYILNELLSIIENAGRMGANVPEWLSLYIAVLKKKIDDKDYGDSAAQ
ncbi:MAG: phage holin family protein [Lachnospiraceae bacterium]|nr:phage holin family protein [Lachnospiraceae bacterium]